MASKSTGTGKRGDGSAGVRGLSDTAKARGGKTIGTPKRGTAAAEAGAGRGPGGVGVNPRSAAKMVGGGLAAGSTDFGPGNAGASGGRAGSRGNATRTSGIGGTMPTGGGGGAASGGLNSGGEGATGAFGNTVLATGRRTRGDSRQAIGSADRADADDALTARGKTQPGRSSGKRASGAGKRAGSNRTTGSRPGQDTARGGGQTGDVTASAETLGANAIAASTGSTPSGSRVRPGDITNDGGRGVRNDPGPNLAPARGGSADVDTPTGDPRGGWKGATKSAREATARRGKQPRR